MAPKWLTCHREGEGWWVPRDSGVGAVLQPCPSCPIPGKPLEKDTRKLCAAGSGKTAVQGAQDPFSLESSGNKGGCPPSPSCFQTVLSSGRCCLGGPWTSLRSVMV